MRILQTVAACFVLVLALPAQAPHATEPVGKLPVYDVSTVKPAGGEATGRESMFSAGTYSGINLTLRDLLRTAFDLQDDLIAELPAWAGKTRFDVKAKAVSLDEATARTMPTTQKIEMLRRMLEDRFQLKWHMETRQVPVYELQVARSGIKMAGASTDGKGSGIRSGRAGEFTGINCQMDVLAEVLSDEVHRVVLDKTALAGRYHFTLKFTREDAPAGSADADAPSIFTALQEQLGLKLQPTRGPAQVLVVDSASLPVFD